jgi:type I restriction enzyme M protein
LSWLAVNGTTAIVEFPGVLYRCDAERRTPVSDRQQLLRRRDPAAAGPVLRHDHCDLHHRAPKSKADNAVLFIDASDQFTRVGNKNKLAAEHQQHIVGTFIARTDVDHVATLVPNQDIAANDYNIAVSSYVEAEDTREVVDITALNAEISRIVTRQAELRTSLDEIVADLEGATR